MRLHTHYPREQRPAAGIWGRLYKELLKHSQIVVSEESFPAPLAQRRGTANSRELLLYIMTPACLTESVHLLNWAKVALRRWSKT